MSGWSFVFSGAGPGSFSVATLTLDNSDRGLASAAYTRQTANIGYAQMNLYCSAPGTATGSVGQGWSSALPSGWTALNGQIGAGSTSTADPYTINSTDAAPNGGTQGTNLHANLCPAGTEVRMARFQVWNSGTSSYADHYLLRSGTAPATTCAASFVNPRAAYIGTALTVMFGWSGSVPPAGWRVHAPGDGWTSSGSTSQGSVPRTKASGAAEYEATITVAGLVAGTTSVRISNGSDFACYVVVVPGSVALVNGVPNIGSDPTTGEECSTWDLFCQMKAALSWVFVPDDESQDALAATFDGLSEKFPFAVPATLATWGDLIIGCSNSDGPSFECPDVFLRYEMPGTSTPVAGAGVVPNGGQEFFVIADELSPANEPGFMAGLHDKRGILNAAVWLAFIGGLAWAVYRWATPFGVLAAWGGRSSGKSDD